MPTARALNNRKHTALLVLLLLRSHANRNAWSDPGGPESRDPRDEMPKQIQAFTVSQWLRSWDKADFDPNQLRRKPPQQFLLFSLEASTLRRLSSIQRRSTRHGRPRAQDPAVQRGHDRSRSREIAEYVRHGFPWSKLSEPRRASGDYDDLIKPGWLPTAIVVNILLPDDERNGKSVHPRDLVTASISGSMALLTIPDVDQDDWQPKSLPPLEVIDGQHRLWAFDARVPDYEVPVVAFHGLDRSWQAYLFYTINISPKRINSSLAFDLYPLLRTEDWLERFEGHSIYRESRAQELTEAMWANPESPWYRRINMLGERGTAMVTQNSWIRALTATFVKSWEGPRVQIGGLFGAPVGKHELVLSWNRAQHAAFLIFSWRALSRALDSIDPVWTHGIDDSKHSLTSPAALGLESANSMLNSEMGVRGLLYILNDLCYVRADKLKLADWVEEEGAAATSDEAVLNALESLAEQPVGGYVSSLVEVLASYDWRSSKAPNLEQDERQLKARFRGGTGYRELRQELLQYVANVEGDLGDAAREVISRLKYDV